jgi:hypothetical protein
MPLLLVLAAHSSPSWAGRDGVDYVADADALISGGSYLSARTQNPADAHTLYVEQLRTHMREILHRSDGVMSDVQAAPRGNLVAVVEGVWEENVSPQRATYVDRRINDKGEVVERFYFEESRLVVLNIDGTVVDSVAGVRRYAWDPSGTRIAYITGNYSEDTGFQTTGTWTYDVSAKQAQRIHSGGRDVQWAAWDGNIYIYDPSKQSGSKSKVLRYDAQTRELAATSRQGIYFSPDGSYYYAAQYGGADLRIFKTQDDRPVPIDPSTAADGTRVAWSAAGWLDGATLILAPATPSDSGDYLYDLAKGGIRSATGMVLPQRSRSNRALVQQGASVVERSESDFTTVK